jgi:hypothetical protein
MLAGSRHPPSSAASRATMSMPPTPASMLWMTLVTGYIDNRHLDAVGSVNHQKPRSIVMPRSFSSCKRSVDAVRRG